MQRAEFESRPESWHCKNRCDFAFPLTWPNVPTFSEREQSFELLGLIDGFEPKVVEVKLRPSLMQQRDLLPRLEGGTSGHC